MTITESVHSILASDAEPIRMYKWSGSAPARGIIQIAHGMGEHALRYRPIAHALVSAGYTVYANDHRGHGEFAAQANALGDFGPGGFPVLVDDMVRVTQAARDADKGKPLVLLGHSMGSFAAQLYLLDHSELLDGVALSGTNRARSAGRRGNGGSLEARGSQCIFRARANPVRLAEPRQGRCRRLHRRSAVRIQRQRGVVWVTVRRRAPARDRPGDWSDTPRSADVSVRG